MAGEFDRRATDEEQLTKYPDTVLDSAKAEHMAHASAEFEDKLRFSAKAAIMSANGDVEGLKDMGANTALTNGRTGYTTDQFVEVARGNRVAADNQAAIAGEKYDADKAREAELVALSNGQS